jgi:cobalt-zinc-cadmium efflux system outer membrane protein
VNSGAASTVEQRRAGIVLARSKITAEHAEHELRASKRRLSMMWGESVPSFVTVEANLFAPREVPTYDDLAARIDENPELIRFVKEQAVQSARLALAESQAVPDLSLHLGGRRTEGPEVYSLVFGISAPITLFQRNQGAIGVAKSKHSELVALQAAERGQLLASLYGYAQEISHAKGQFEMLHQEILPDAEAVLTLVTRGFKSGRFSQIELLEAQRTLVELEHERIGTAEKMWTLAVRINSIMGNALKAAESRSSDPMPGDSPSARGDNDE